MLGFVLSLSLVILSAAKDLCILLRVNFAKDLRIYSTKVNTEILRRFQLHRMTALAVIKSDQEAQPLRTADERREVSYG